MPILEAKHGAPTGAKVTMGLLSVLIVASCTHLPPSAELSSFKAEQIPYKNGVLVIAGTKMPIQVVAQSKPGEVVFLLRSKHGETLEHEAYKFDSERFALWRAGGELYDPVIPLLRNPISAGSSWDWSGTMTSAIDGTPSQDPEAKTNASARITLNADRLNIRPEPADAYRVDVELKVDSGGRAPAAVRKLSFWFVNGRGMVKREFAAASTRLPEDEETP